MVFQNKGALLWLTPQLIGFLEINELNFLYYVRYCNIVTIRKNSKVFSENFNIARNAILRRYLKVR